MSPIAPCDSEQCAFAGNATTQIYGGMTEAGKMVRMAGSQLTGAFKGLWGKQGKGETSPQPTHDTSGVPAHTGVANPVPQEAPVATEAPVAPAPTKHVDSPKV
jgi:hypothetical protein